MTWAVRKFIYIGGGMIAGLVLVWVFAAHAWFHAGSSSPSGPEDSGSPTSNGPPPYRAASPDGMIASYLYGFDRGGKTGGRHSADSATAQRPHSVGLRLNDPRAYPGYTLLAPLTGTTTCLIDMQGRVVHTWASNCTPALSAYLLDNGHLLRTGTLGRKAAGFGPGFGGRVQEFTWTGQLVWDFKLATREYRPHHDAIRLPNGNVLIIVLEKKTADEARAAGRKPELVNAAPWQPDALIEVQPTGKKTGKVVWEWHVADHVVQDYDPSQANYGAVASHPERIDVNHQEGQETTLVANQQQLKSLRSIGYVGASASSGHDPEWTHINSVAYNADLDQVLLSVRAFSEIWIIDHGTTTQQAASHSGGRRGKGGDLLYRWGNPATYRTGRGADHHLFAQHDASWIAPGLPGAGHILVFNNGMGRPQGNYSSVDEIAPPVNNDSSYALSPAKTYGPDHPVWSYTAVRQADFSAALLSGAQRLANGDTLICDGMTGTVFEVTPEKEVVWKYICPAVRTVGKSGAGSETPLYRAYRYALSHPGLAGKKLVPGPTIEELEKKADTGLAEGGRKGKSSSSGRSRY